MTTKTNLTQPTYNSPDWNTPLNANFGVLNDALGNTESVSVALADVTLNATQAQKMRIAVTASPMTANRTLFFPNGCSGFWIITNATTGAYTLTVKNVSGVASVVVGQGVSAIVYSDGTNVSFANDYLAPGSIGTSSIADSAVTTAKLANSSVTTAKIADANVTTAKIAAANVTTATIADANITPAKLSGAQSGSAPIYGVRAWGRINISGTVASVSYGGNVASASYISAGNISVAFTTAMSNASYSVVATADTTTITRTVQIASKSASGFTVYIGSDGGQLDSVPFNFMVIQ